jgi:predicted permease
MTSGAALRSWWIDLRRAVRGVRRAKAFYATAVLTLAIGMAGATVMFTLIRGILLRPLPVADEDRLVVSWRVPRAGPASHVPYPATHVESLSRESRTLAAVAGVGYNGAIELGWEDGGRILSARTAAVMGEFFAVAGVTPILGQALSRQHDRVGFEKALVLSFGAWQRLFGGSPDVVGRTLVAGKQAFTIAGVMPPDFEYPRGVEVWTTLTALAETGSNPGFREALLRDVELLARLRPGVSVAQAEGELTTLVSRLDAVGDAPTFVDFRPVVRPFKELVVGDLRGILPMLFASAGLILLIAVANVAILLLMRGERRRGELVVRAALGASRRRLVGELITESLIVAVVAGALGLLLSHWSLRTVTTLVPDGLPRLSSIRTDATVVAFAMGLAFVAAALSGLVPALGGSRLDLVAELRAGGRGASGGTRTRGRRLLVASQVALAVTIVGAAGLLGRSLRRLQTVDTGMAADGLVIADLDLPQDRYADPVRRRTFLDEVTARLGAAPGIEAVTPLNVQPFAGSAGWDVPRFTAEGQTADQVALNPSLNFEAVHVPYFSTLGVTVRRGRPFTAADREDAPRVAVVSDTLAAITWPGQDPLGRRLKFGGFDSESDWLTVVGVVGTTRYRDLATPRPTLYVPAEQFMISAERLAVRGTAALAAVAGVVGDIVRSVDPTASVTRVASYAEYQRGPLAWPRFNALLLAVLGATSLLLSAIGLYGVMAASVRERLAEIGVRMALGATALDIRRLVLGEGLRLAIGGAAAGLALAAVSTRVLRTLLFETTPLDPLSLVGAAALLVAAAVLASYLPARRATRVDPLVALRAE